MMKYATKLLLLALPLLLFTSSKPVENEVSWITLEKADQVMNQQPKLLYVDLYTDWCGWCKVMDRKTFKHPVIIDLLDKYYYAVKFNAEKPSDKTFNGKEYGFNQQSGRRGLHEFAMKFGATSKGMSYPTTILFTPDKQLIQAIPGYLDPHMMEKVLTYFAKGYPQRGVAWPEFDKTFKGKIPPSK